MKRAAATGRVCWQRCHGGRRTRPSCEPPDSLSADLPHGLGALRHTGSPNSEPDFVFPHKISEDALAAQLRPPQFLTAHGGPVLATKSGWPPAPQKLPVKILRRSWCCLPKGGQIGVALAGNDREFIASSKPSLKVCVRLQLLCIVAEESCQIALSAIDRAFGNRILPGRACSDA